MVTMELACEGGAFCWCINKLMVIKKQLQVHGGAEWETLQSPTCMEWYNWWPIFALSTFQSSSKQLQLLTLARYCHEILTPFESNPGVEKRTCNFTCKRHSMDDWAPRCWVAYLSHLSLPLHQPQVLCISSNYQPQVLYISSNYQPKISICSTRQILYAWNC